MQTCKYVSVVKNVKDLDYFEQKSQSLELACGRRLELLSLCWEASDVGMQLSLELQQDSSGESATESLRACFGIKSPSTLLKRAGTFRQFVRWFNLSEHARDGTVAAFPLVEAVVWDYFILLRAQRNLSSKGFTGPSTFLETVPFAKFTVGLTGADDVLQSRRLLGFASVERSLKGPARQAPGLELVRLQRLREILCCGDSLVDRLGAAVFLICVYARARWSDLRFVDYVEFDRGRRGTMTIYTREHKTSNIGIRREQYLPLIIPWEGVTSDWWIDAYCEVCDALGFDLSRKPLGPLLPAPRLGGGFCARPLSTTEAAQWLRSLLKGTKDADSFRSRSLKATLLGWAARSGLDKECRAVLGHHCAAISGSEVVYSRNLQFRAIRKLSMLLRRVRIGLDLEDDNMKNFGIACTPGLVTPTFMPATPHVPTTAPAVSQVATETEVLHSAAPSTGVVVSAAGAVDAAVETMADLEDLESVKDELFDLDAVGQHAENLTLFPSTLVQSGVIAIESSSGSDSSSSSSSSSDGELPARSSDAPSQYVENVPEGFRYYKRKKSGIVHSRKDGSDAFACKVKPSSNFLLLPFTRSVRYPKCLKRFPKDPSRVRSLSDLNRALEGALKRARHDA